MKNFDYELYKSLQNGESTLDWLKMCEKCYHEYLLCCSSLSSRFTDWYDKGGFHDATLKGVYSKIDKSNWSTTIVLEKWMLGRVSTIFLNYKDVANFSIKKNIEGVFKGEHETCLYDEFYRSPHNEKKIVHEFFTSNDTFFYLEFTKMTCVIKNVKFNEITKK